MSFRSFWLLRVGRLSQLGYHAAWSAAPAACGHEGGEVELQTPSVPFLICRICRLLVGAADHAELITLRVGEHEPAVLVVENLVAEPGRSKRDQARHCRFNVL